MLFIATVATGKIGNEDTNGFASAIYRKILLDNIQIKAFSRKKKSLLADVAVQGKVISLVVAHTSVPTKQHTFSDRNQQLAAMGKYAAQVKNSLVVARDFNATRWSLFYKNMVKTGGLRNMRSGLRILLTWATFEPVVYSDRPFASWQRT